MEPWTTNHTYISHVLLLYIHSHFVTDPTQTFLLSKVLITVKHLQKLV